MRITVKEAVELANAFQQSNNIAQKLEREKALGIMQDEQHKMNVRVKQCAEALVEKANNAQGVYEGEILARVRSILMDAATTVRDMLDDRPPPETDPDAAKRFPSMFRGGPV